MDKGFTTFTPDQTDTEFEADEPREALAARLERLARRVRQGGSLDTAKLDAAYADVVKLAHQMRDLLG